MGGESRLAVANTIMPKSGPEYVTLTEQTLFVSNCFKESKIYGGTADSYSVLTTFPLTSITIMKVEIEFAV